MILTGAADWVLFNVPNQANSDSHCLLNGPIAAIAYPAQVVVPEIGASASVMCFHRSIQTMSEVFHFVCPLLAVALAQLSGPLFRGRQLNLYSLTGFNEDVGGDGSLI